MLVIHNLTSSYFRKVPWEKAARVVLEGENSEKKIISLLLISKRAMGEMNKKYLKREGATDVLSFNSRARNFPSVGEENFLGEIVICPSFVLENARRFALNKEEELLRVFVHGLLHLLGYDHKKKRESKAMKAKEDFYLKMVIGKNERQ